MNDDINNEPDIIYKFILIGDSNVGKNDIFKKIAYSEFNQNNIATIGIDYKSLNYEIEIEENGKKIKKKVRINLLDTSGQDRFRSIIKGYINNSNGIIIVYDITNRSSFDNVIGWIKFIEEKFGNCEQMKACIFLIGNKKDLVEGEEGEKRREVQINEAENLAEKYDLIWGGECSAKEYTKKQFDEIFIKFTQIIYSKYGYEKQDKAITLIKHNIKKKKKISKC